MQIASHGAQKAVVPSLNRFRDLRDEIRDTHDVRCATPNFFAITHYNRSYFYAASVADLAHEIADRVGYGDPNRFGGPGA